LKEIAMLIHTKLAAQTLTPVCAPEVSTLLAEAQPCATSRYGRDEVIYAHGDAVGPLYLVEFGTVRIVRLTADGRRQVIAFHFAGEVFGFEAGREHQCYAESVDAAGVRVLRPQVRGGFDAHSLGLALIGMARAQDHALLLGRMNANEKLACFLLDLAERQDSDRFVDLSMSRSDIADYLGITFETVSRVLRVFKDRRIVRLAAIDRVEILNFSALEAFSEC
jgi:CRP/FNR family nitrogen fixation transcriptional regulator